MVLFACFESFWKLNTNPFCKAWFTLMQLCWRDKSSEADGLVNPELILAQPVCVSHCSFYTIVVLVNLLLKICFYYFWLEVLISQSIILWQKLALVRKLKKNNTAWWWFCATSSSWIFYTHFSHLTICVLL